MLINTQMLRHTLCTRELSKFIISTCVLWHISQPRFSATKLIVPNSGLNKLYFVHLHCGSGLPKVRLFEQLHTKTGFFSGNAHANCKDIHPEKGNSMQQLIYRNHWWCEIQGKEKQTQIYIPQKLFLLQKIICKTQQRRKAY